MLPAPHRLTGERRFAQLAGKGRPVHGQYLSIKYATGGGPVTRIGIVISKKVSKKAVERNRLRRQLRELLRPELPRITGGLDMMILVRPGTVGTAREKLSHDLFTVLRKARLITDDK
jgi:ribonuclease P protein component